MFLFLKKGKRTATSSNMAQKTKVQFFLALFTPATLAEISINNLRIEL